VFTLGPLGAILSHPSVSRADTNPSVCNHLEQLRIAGLSPGSAAEPQGSKPFPSQNEAVQSPYDWQVKHPVEAAVKGTQGEGLAWRSCRNMERGQPSYSNDRRPNCSPQAPAPTEPG